MRIITEIWRQSGPEDPGRFEHHEIADATPAMSLLELLDRLNAQLVEAGADPVVFEHDCREGICGCCGLLVDGVPHGPEPNTPSCLQRVRSFADGQTVRLEPFRARDFPVIRDLMVDRAGLDRIIAAGGFVSTRTGSAPEANSIPIAKATAETAMDFAACIGCGACVAACPNGSAQLFLGAKLAQFSHLPQGAPERATRARSMAAAAASAFGGCSDVGVCAVVCPAGIPLEAVAAANAEVLKARLRRRS